MKKIAILFVLAVSIISCKNETKTEDSSKESDTVVAGNLNTDESLKTIEGEFLFVDGAGVIMGKNFIYGVSLDEMTEKLIKQVSDKQKDKFDMVPVVIKGEIHPKPEGSDVWDEIVTIKEIIEVLPSKGNEPIKIETGK
ncbi:hypothetical protein [uncultured Dokdonia sp.]|uniref:hypothetical protein n=1 Tax=uncultured Dokdonia sp. TaxID=575653 RepID=UPI00261BA54D|nr:hypothetical protein [uncultured Dokdonia sp.]